VKTFFREGIGGLREASASLHLALQKIDIHARKLRCCDLDSVMPYWFQFGCVVQRAGKPALTMLFRAITDTRAKG
jgi:hypothetical protein